MEIQFVIFLNLLLFCCVFCDNDVRKLSVTLNPGCESGCDDIIFIHVEAKSDENKIHYLWDLTGSPSLFLAKTDINGTLEIKWSDFMSGETNSIKFSSQPDFIFSSVIKNILLFDDVNDQADVNHESVKDVTIFDPHNFTWKKINLTQDENQVMLVVSADIGTNGSFAVKVIFYVFPKYLALMLSIQISSDYNIYEEAPKIICSSFKER